MNKAQR
jgi:26S proteasome regulatory subunit N10